MLHLLLQAKCPQKMSAKPESRTFGQVTTSFWKCRYRSRTPLATPLHLLEHPPVCHVLGLQLEPDTENCILMTEHSVTANDRDRNKDMPVERPFKTLIKRRTRSTFHGCRVFQKVQGVARGFGNGNGTSKMKLLPAQKSGSRVWLTFLGHFACSSRCNISSLQPPSESPGSDGLSYVVFHSNCTVSKRDPVKCAFD